MGPDSGRAVWGAPSGSAPLWSVGGGCGAGVGVVSDVGGAERKATVEEQLCEVYELAGLVARLGLHNRKGCRHGGFACLGGELGVPEDGPCEVIDRRNAHRITDRYLAQNILDLGGQVGIELA